MDENRTKRVKKWGKNCQVYVAVDEEIQNQNGVVFSSLKDATKIVLVKWGFNNIGYSLTLKILRIQMVNILVIKCYLFNKNPGSTPGHNLNVL